MPLRLPILFFAALISSSAFAEGLLSTPNWPAEAGFKANTGRDPVSPVKFGRYVVTLEKTTLEQVMTAFGVGSLKQEGDASEAVTWLCYNVTSPIKHRIWLTSSELWGGSVIDGVSAGQIGTSDPGAEGCPELPVKFLPVRLSNGIWIGSSEQTIRQKLGSGKMAGAILAYIYRGRQGKFDVHGSAAIRMKEGKATAINIVHTTTN